jgi:hypothetical protein
MMTVKIGETEMEKKILFAISEDWLAQRREDPIDPAMPIIDPHHHLWDRGSRYLLDEIKQDIDASGHNAAWACTSSASILKSGPCLRRRRSWPGHGGRL